MAQVKKDLIIRKEFIYSHGITELKFILRIDNKTELLSFRKCLIQALIDIEEEIKK